MSDKMSWKFGMTFLWSMRKKTERSLESFRKKNVDTGAGLERLRDGVAEKE